MEIPIHQTKNCPWFRPVITVRQLIHSPELSLLTSVRSVLCWTTCKV